MFISDFEYFADTFHGNPGATIPEPLPPCNFCGRITTDQCSVQWPGPRPPGHCDNGTISPWNLTPSIQQLLVIKMFHGDPRQLTLPPPHLTSASTQGNIVLQHWINYFTSPPVLSAQPFLHCLECTEQGMGVRWNMEANNEENAVFFLQSKDFIFNNCYRSRLV